MGKEVGILVVDVGTTKVCALIGEEREGELWVTGIGIAPSQGLKKGMVLNIDEATQSIKNAIEKALTQAKVEIGSVYVSIAGAHIKTIPGMGVVALKQKCVTEEDVEEVLRSAQNLNLPPETEILHVIPQEFILDQQGGILQPVGMTGVRLEAHVKLIVCNRSSLQNLLRCFENLNLGVDGVIFQGLASAEAVLTPEEKELGVVLLDFGGGTTDVVIYWDNVLRDVFSIQVGGEHLTNDLAVGLRTSRREAEKLKIEKGVCLRELVEEDEIIEVAGIGNRPPRKVNKKFLAEILEPRVKELFELIERELRKEVASQFRGFDLKSKIGSGIVITGGSSLIPGLVYLADQMFDLPARIGYPIRLAGLTEEVSHPQFSTAVGMLLYAYNYGEKTEPTEKEEGFLEKLKKIYKKFLKGG
ncbi:cell division protein FtsA [Thermodesulfobacterium sp. TA1]|uniref:cell division protein FtsA n=1 Tax=Thermodesulfobacterium sp. TA1 TaxID=2234087 RepID=UPI0012329426|nr:cell division protein FtsA [Thermodesulfobacterium sp. TA1]QER41669.1 cell division protein FtsA [Thermodesulfobacterium sp. TA1]